MSVPASRNDFAEYCLRKLGKPVIEINVEWDQVQDRIDEALMAYYDYHSDGSEKTYYSYEITAQDITNQYITLPQNIIGAINIFAIGDNLDTNNIFNVRYQILLNDLPALTNVDIVPYYMAMQHIQLLEEVLVGQQPIRYNRNSNILYIDMDWTQVIAGQYFIVECYQVIDPDVYTRAWGERWLIAYATALIKEQWGSNIKKYSGLQLPGQITMNGQAIYEEAIAEKKELWADLIESYSLPPSYMIG